MLDQRDGFPLNEPIHEAGIVFCTTEEAVRKLVTLHSEKGIEAARDYFNAPDVPCGTERNVLVVYHKLVLSVKVKGGERNVYEATAGTVKVFIVTDWRHQRKEI